MTNTCFFFFQFIQRNKIMRYANTAAVGMASRYRAWRVVRMRNVSVAELKIELSLLSTLRRVQHTKRVASSEVSRSLRHFRLKHFFYH